MHVCMSRRYIVVTNDHRLQERLTLATYTA